MSHKVTIFLANSATALTLEADQVHLRERDVLASPDQDRRVLYVNPGVTAVLIEPQSAPTGAEG